LYRDHRKGPGGPPGGAPYPGGPRGLKVEGNQPLVGWGDTIGHPPMRLGLGTLGVSSSLHWGARHPFPPLAAAPPWRSHLPGLAPPPGAYIKGGGRAATYSLGRLPLPLQHLSLSLAEAWRSPAGDPLHPPPRRRAVGSPSTSPSPLLDQEGGDIAAPYVC